MAITVDWATRVINVPRADLTSLGGSLYELDLDVFRLALKALEAGDEGMAYVDTHSHNTAVTVAGTTVARVVEIINGYSVTFEDGQYAVNLVGANSNVADATNVNQVSIRSFNTAGLIQVAGGSADWSDAERSQLRDALGVDGTKVAATGGQLQNVPTTALMTSSELEQLRSALGIDGAKTDAANGQLQIIDGLVRWIYRFRGLDAANPLTTVRVSDTVDTHSSAGKTVTVTEGPADTHTTSANDP